MPIADRLSLRKLCFEGVDEALKEAKIQLTEEQSQAFVRHFVNGLEIRLQTPRMAKRYKNTLAFSLPILKGEVNPVDLMLIEGMRVFYPKLYELTRDNPDVFLCSQLNTYGNRDEVKRNSLEVIKKSLEGLTSDEREAAEDLLKALFPRLKGLFGNVRYGSEWEDSWAKEQRVASKQYFNRFFSYTIPEGDISDQEIESFLVRVESESITNIAHEIQRLVEDRSAGTFVLKLRRKAKKLSSNTSRDLATAISKVGESFPNPKTMYPLTAFSEAGILISQLVGNIPQGEDRFNTAKLIALEGQPISFAFECFRWMRTTEEKEEQDRTLSVKEENEIGKIIVDRIKELSQEQPIYIRSPKETSLLLLIWSLWGSREETNKYLAKTLDEDPHNALEFLKCYLPIGWDMESGLSKKGDLQIEEYNSITNVVDADLIYNTIYKIYGSDLDTPRYHGDSDRFLEEQVAHQFAHIYHDVKTKDQKAAGKKNNPEGI